MRTKTLRVVVLVAVIGLLAQACAMKSLFVSGVSLEAVGTQFASVSEQVTLGCERRVILPPTCEKYRVFGEHFKKTYPLAVGMWEAARKANDGDTKKKAEDVVRSLSVDLSALAAEALGAFAPGAR